jgi:N-acetylmuramoyl-L-alanine amidase
MNYLVILDAGHSKFTLGKATPPFADGVVMHEWEFNSAVVHKIFEKSKSYEKINVFLTNTEKYDVTLDDRCQRANQAWQDFKDKNGEENCKCVLISVHANAMKDTWNDIGNGTATFYYSTNLTDKAFASVIQKNLIAKTKLNAHRGGVVGDNFQIIREVKMTACLCECAFMDNLKEATLLRTEQFREDCADGIFNGILEYFEIEKIKELIEKPIEEPVEVIITEPVKEPIKTTSEVIYTVTKNGTYQLMSDVSNFGVKIVKQKNNTIEEPNCCNGTFFWWEDVQKTKPYPTSILIKDGVILQNRANHFADFGCPQNVFIVYKDGRVAMKKVNFATDILDYKNIAVGLGGIGLVDKTNPNFKYNPASEGFKWGYNQVSKKYVSYTDVLRATAKVVVGYNIKLNKIFLMVRKNIIHSSAVSYDLLDLVKDCEYDIAISLDGGGSVFLNNADDMVVIGDGRYISNIVGFGL